MHQYIFGHDDLVAQFVASLIPECRMRGFGKCKAIGIADANGQLLGGLVYRNWCPEVGTIEISGAAVPGTNWLSRRTVQVMYNYPFYQCGCQMVIKTTMADNMIVLRIMAAIGFTLHPIKRLGGQDRDGVVGTLTREDWEASRYNLNRRPEEIVDAELSERDGRPARPHYGGADEHQQPAAADANAADAADAAADADAANAAARQSAAGRTAAATAAGVDAAVSGNAAATATARHAASRLRAGNATGHADAGNATEVTRYEQA